MKAQFGIEFFLVLTVVMAFILLFYASSVTESERTRVLESAVLAKAAVYSLSERADLVYLSGAGSRASLRVFVPQGANCFYLDGENRVYCSLTSPEVYSVAESDEVRGPVLRAPASFALCPGPLEQGEWIELNATAVAGGVAFEC